MTLIRCLVTKHQLLLTVQHHRLSPPVFAPPSLARTTSSCAAQHIVSYYAIMFSHYLRLTPITACPAWKHFPDVLMCQRPACVRTTQYGARAESRAPSFAHPNQPRAASVTNWPTAAHVDRLAPPPRWHRRGVPSHARIPCVLNPPV